MDTITATNTTTSQMGPQMYAIKQASKIPEETVMPILDSLQAQTDATPISGLADQGIGSKLDIKG